MRKIKYLALALLMALPASAQDRAHILKVYNWADYLDMNLIPEFELWYKRQTGEDVKVIYETFDINENMLTEIEVGREDYDVVCPSEYIIERMLRKGLLQKIDTTDFARTSTPNWLGNVSPFAEEKFQQMAANPQQKVRDYAVGYMWGTTGILYNRAYVRDDEVQSWTALYNDRFEKQIYMKDAFRDVYCCLICLARYEDILAGKVSRDSLATDLSNKNISAVERVLTKAKPQIAGWEADFGKERMSQGKCWIDVTWSGDAQWAINEEEDGVDLAYVVPKEGSNCWFDGWVIPIYARNTRAAAYWINFLCRSECAVCNMDETGYVSVIGTPLVLKAMEDAENNPQTVDASYFFRFDSDGVDLTRLHLNPVFYPDRSVIDRTVLMHDTADRNEAMLEMWSRVKGNNLNWKMIVFIGVVLGSLLLYTVNSKLHKMRRLKRRKAMRK